MHKRLTFAMKKRVDEGSAAVVTAMQIEAQLP